MLDITKDIEALTTFRRNSAEIIQRLKRSRRPLILTVNGKAEAVVQDAKSYQRLLNLAAQADAEEGIRQGMEDSRKERKYPAREVFAVMRKKQAIPRLS